MCIRDSSIPANSICRNAPARITPVGASVKSSSAKMTSAGAFRQIEFAGILEGAAHPVAAEKLIDFLLSVAFQEDIPLNMFVFPANEEAGLPGEFLRHTVIPEDPISIDPGEIEDNR